MANLPEWVTTLEAAELLGVSRSTVHRMIDSGELQPVGQLPGLRGAFLLARSEIEALVQS